MNQYEEMMQSLRDLVLPTCKQAGHFDNLILLKLLNNNQQVKPICGQCLLEDQIEEKSISIKVFLKLILDELFIKLEKYNELYNNKVNSIDHLLSLLYEIQNIILAKIKEFEIIKKTLTKYNCQDTSFQLVKNTMSELLTTKFNQQILSDKLNNLSEQITINNQSESFEIKIKQLPIHAYGQITYELTKNNLLEIMEEVKNINLKTNLEFDVQYSENFFNFDNKNSIAIFKQNSEFFPNEFSTISDYKIWPNTRVSQIIDCGVFHVKFKISGNGFFGLGTPELSPNGFPGYTPYGFMNYSQGSIAWICGQKYYDEDHLLTNRLNIQNKEVLFTIYADKKKCQVNFDNQEIERDYPLPNPVYVVFALTSGQVEIIQ